jgi:hypothetical protein
VSRLRGRGNAGSYQPLEAAPDTNPAIVGPAASVKSPSPSGRSLPPEAAPRILEPAAVIETTADREPAPVIDSLTQLPAVVKTILEPAEQKAEPADDHAVCEADLLAMAALCTELGRVATTSEVAALLDQASGILGAAGLILWVWDPIASELSPALANGYSDQVLAQLPRVDRDGNNATAAAFRERDTCIVHSTDHVSGALAVPLLTSVGCAGVLAMELNHRREEQPAVRALATILAAQVASLLGSAQPSKAADRRLA